MPDIILPDISSIEGNVKPKTAEAFTYFNDLAIEHGNLAAVSMSIFGYSVHVIMRDELWKFGQDDSGQTFQSQKEYLKWLKTKFMAGVGASTLKGYHSALMLAEWLGYEPSQILERGIQPFVEVKRLVKTTQDGQPVAYRFGPTPDNMAEHLRQTIEEVSINPAKQELRLTYGDLKAELERRLTNRPNIYFTRKHGAPITDLKWYYEATRDDGTLDFFDGKLTIMFNNNPPLAVQEKMLDKLGVGIED